MCVVVFNAAAFKVRYPSFAAVSDPLLQLYFDESTLYLDNTECSPIVDCVRRAVLLNMITAHIAYIAQQGASGAPQGNVTSATEGSVSASFEVGVFPNSAAWWKLSPYGLAYFQATASKRIMFYIPGRSSNAPLPSRRRVLPWLR